MSYDIEIWSVQPLSLPDGISFGGRWTAHDDVSIHSGQNWQIIVHQSVAVDDQDIPELISRSLPGIANFTELSVEPSEAPEAARQLLLRNAKGLAKSSYGVVYDPQEDSVVLPSGVKKFVPPAREEKANTLLLSWWFEHEGPLLRHNFQEMLNLLKKYVPEALPRRYGTFEPPEHKYEGDDDKLLEFLVSTTRAETMVIWYPTKPVVDVSLSLPNLDAKHRLGFRVNSCSIEFDIAVLGQPGWEKQIRRLWRSMSKFLEPFYGDVRIMRGYHRHAGRLWCSSDTDVHPVRSWFWRGLPHSGGVAAVLGQPYRGLWKQFEDAAQVDGSLAYLDANDWMEGTDVFENFAGVPDDLVNPNTGRDLELYSSRWPFAPFN